MTIHPKTLDPADTSTVMLMWKTPEGVAMQMFPMSEVTNECARCFKRLVERPGEMLVLKKDKIRCLKCGGP